jgi:Beta-propeller repeat
MKTRIRWGTFAGFVLAGSVVLALLLFTLIRTNTSHFSRSTSSQPSNSAVATPTWKSTYAQLPMGFEENRGQAARNVRFVSHGSGYGVAFAPQEADITLLRRKAMNASPLHRAAYLRALRAAVKAQRTTAIHMRLEGANPSAEIAGTDKLPGKSNYFVGNNPKNWVTDVPAYARVKYSAIYPGIDLVFYGNQRHLEYDFVVAPGADPKAIRLKVDGARKLALNSRGDLILSVPDGEVEFLNPVIYQMAGTERREIAGNYVLAAGNRVSFAVSKYDESLPLVIDPLLNYATYLGGSDAESGAGIAVDGSGDVFVVGTTMSTDFPVVAATAVVPTAPVAGCGFVTELDPTGATKLYSSYLCGSSSLDAAFAVAVDSSGDVYVTGTTSSLDFPPMNGLTPPTTIPGSVAFVTKLNPQAKSGAASLLYSSFVGGTAGDFGNAIAVDGSGNAYIGGFTISSPGAIGSGGFTVTPGAFQPAPDPLNTVGTAFLARIDTTKSGNASLIYATYLGGNAANQANFLDFGEQISGVAVDTANIAYVTGVTSSTNFPSFNGLPGTPIAANTAGAAFVSRIDTTKTTQAPLTYSTYLEGSNFDSGFGIALGPDNVAYVTGVTDSTDFPIMPNPGAFQTTGNVNGVAFISLVDTTLSGAPSLKYSTFFGGSNGNTGFGIQADSAGVAYVVGTTASGDFPITPTVLPATLSNPNGVAFVVKLNPAGGGTSDRIYASYFGGSGDGTDADQGFAIAIDNNKNAYITGSTSSADLPTTKGSFQPALDGPSDAYIAKLPLLLPVVISPSSVDFGTQSVGVKSNPQSVTITNNNFTALTINSITIVATAPPAAGTDFAISNNPCPASLAAGASCTVMVTFTPSVAAAESASLVFNDGDPSSPQSATLTGTGTAVAADFTVTAPAAVTVSRGSSKMFNVTVTPIAGFNQAVALTCTGAPNNTTCTIVGSPVTPDGVNPINAQVTVTAKSLLPSSPTRIPPPSSRQIVLIAVGLSLLAMVFATKRLRTRLSLAGAMLVVFAVAGCSGTPRPRTTNITLTGTSGALSHSAVVALTVD